ncbi:Rv1733c family protein [Bounagaea algeriensis]
MAAGRTPFGLRSLFRGVRERANPLWRGTDWFEPLAVAVLVVFLLGGFAAAMLVGQLELSRRIDQVRAEQREKDEVSATVVARAPQNRGTDTVAVRLGEGGDARFAIVDVPSSAASRPEVPLWVDRSGEITSPPMTEGDAFQAAGVTGAFVVVGFAVTGAAGYGAARWCVTRRRLRAWEAEWEKVEPHWRGQPD